MSGLRMRQQIGKLFQDMHFLTPKPAQMLLKKTGLAQHIYRAPAESLA